MLRGTMVVMKGVRKNGLYALEGIVISGSISTEKTVYSKIKLWHERLGHVSKKGLEELDKQGLFRSDKIDQLAFCEHYIHGKACKIRFSMGQ